MDSNDIYTLLLPYCKPGYERTLWVYVQFCVERSQPDNTPDCENHHILPRSLFPEYKNLSRNPWNQSRLTFREHYRAHKLLARCIGGSMFQALWFMGNSRWNGGYRVSLQEYEQARKRHGKAISETNKGNQYSLGRKHSDETKKNMSDSKKDIPRSEETKKNISKGRKGILHTEESKIKMSESTKGPKNPFYSIPPWENPKTMKNPDSVQAWREIDRIYQCWLDNGKPGAAKLAKLYGTKANLQCMVKHFKEGKLWHKDPRWSE